MKLILHIGVSKTGTTTLQKWLSQNHATYSKHICYPPDTLLPGTFQGNHRLLPLLAGSDLVWKTDFALDLLERVGSDRNTTNQSAITKIVQHQLQRCIAKAESLGYDALLLSNEHLSDRLSTEDIYHFSERISPLFENKTLIVYLRRQDSALLSLYAESLKHGSTADFRNFIACNQVAKITFDYERIIRDWSTCGWKIVPRIYHERASSPDGWSLINDFTILLNYEVFSDSLTAQNYSLNQSPNVSDLETLRRLNHLQGKIPDSAFFFLKRQALKLKRQHKEVADNRLLDSLIDRYASGNDWIAKTYFNRRHLFSL